ncbi:Putative endonuclease or glycosyl hydrolase [Arabidopsis thaliana]|uniref:Endonuclease or glycosyl hydrolase n=1 Tax=Arabidopsis thaliana TaxID=3702 RepID=F4JD25_ARATH|nr:Putative endonuclease or glycosyl hydrolase [Arabidopsis thaliana]AEE80139.1 Putative endonuclease or glycosyl hydrolase [Arabidopsis thaliana]|eukprot:NP_001190148.1 Putative endonuclease or glycosyl hydrolase [Arabidopsis thaliana]
MLLKLFQQSRFFKSISGLGNVASPSHGFVGTRASRPPAVFGTHYLRLLATDSSPPNDTIGPQYGDPVRLPGYPQPNLCTAKTEIWWDVDSCRLPDSVDPYRLVGNLRKSLNEKGYRGPITSINAFGNTNRIDETTMLALSATGVYTRHIPDGRKESAHKKILVDLLCFGMDNIQQPCNIMLISARPGCSPKMHVCGYQISHLCDRFYDSTNMPILGFTSSPRHRWSSIYESFTSSPHFITTDHVSWRHGTQHIS